MNQEKLDELNARYEYQGRIIQYLRENFNYYVRKAGNLALADQAMNQLLVDRLKLEVEIDLLTEELR